MKKNISDVEVPKERKQNRLFYEKPQCKEVQLIADHTLGSTCSFSSGTTCNELMLMNS